MTVLRNLLADLVEKRLWPITLLLAIAAVAVPVVLGRGGTGAADAPVTPAPATPAGGAPAATPAVKLVGPASVHSRPGPVRDPFRRAKKKKKAPPAATAAPAPAAATTTQPIATTGTGGAPAAGGPAQPNLGVYRTRVRWGKDANAAVHGVSRLQPLGGLSDPAIMYLGTTKGGARALFLLGPNAVDEGEGECAETTCRIIRLKPGDKTVVTVQGADGGVAGRYTLVIDDIVREVGPSANAAEKLRARIHPDGRRVLLEMITDNSENATALGRFQYDLGLGAVVAKRAP
jgi:hypothetical protein